MPQLRRVLNALAGARRRLGRVLGRQRGANPKLDPAAFLVHAAALAAQAPSPDGLWLSVLVDGAADPGKAARLEAAWPKEGPAELVIGAPGAAEAAERLDEALARAQAPFVAWLDLEGALAPFALERIAAALAANPDAAMLYTDEVLTDRAGRPAEVVLKPAFDPVLLDSYDFVGRMAVFRRERLLALGGWSGFAAASVIDSQLSPTRGAAELAPAGRRPAVPGASLSACLSYNLALRFVAGLPAGAILHLPYPGFIGPERRPNPRAAADALAARYRVTGREIDFAPALAPDRLRPTLRPEPRAWPKVSIVVPSRDAPELIARALNGLFAATDYSEFEVIVDDNGSTDPQTLALYADLSATRANFRADIEAGPFNFSRAVNRGVALTDGALALLLNNDVEVVEPGWLKEMVACFDYPDVGIVGAKLLYPDQTLQHVGVIAGLGDYAGHWHIGRPADYLGPQRRLASRQSLSVVTGACMLVSRACFERVGGFDEETFPIAYNDVDFCLRAGAAGFRVVWTPFAKLVHHESASRGSDETDENRARFERDKAALRARHHTDVLEDRAYNPWAVRGHSDPWPSARTTLPPPRA